MIDKQHSFSNAGVVKQQAEHIPTQVGRRLGLVLEVVLGDVFNVCSVYRERKQVPTLPPKILGFLALHVLLLRVLRPLLELLVVLHYLAD